MPEQEEERCGIVPKVEGLPPDVVKGEPAQATPKSSHQLLEEHGCWGLKRVVHKVPSKGVAASQVGHL